MDNNLKSLEEKHDRAKERMAEMEAHYERIIYDISRQIAERTEMGIQNWIKLNEEEKFRVLADALEIMRENYFKEKLKTDLALEAINEFLTHGTHDNLVTAKLTLEQE